MHEIGRYRLVEQELVQSELVKFRNVGNWLIEIFLKIHYLEDRIDPQEVSIKRNNLRLIKWHKNDITDSIYAIFAILKFGQFWLEKFCS